MLLMITGIISQYDFPPPIRLKHYIADPSASEGVQNSAGSILQIEPKRFDSAPGGGEDA